MSATSKLPDRVHVSYTRVGSVARITLEGLTNHELREVITGLWARLDAEDRADHIKALEHYQSDPSSYMSQTATAIAKGDQQ